MVVAMRGARGKKPGRKALLADTRRAGLFVVSAWLGRRWCTSGRRARFAAQVGVGSREKDWEDLASQAREQAGQACRLVQCCERKAREVFVERTRTAFSQHSFLITTGGG